MLTDNQVNLLKEYLEEDLKRLNTILSDMPKNDPIYEYYHGKRSQNDSTLSLIKRFEGINQMLGVK